MMFNIDEERARYERKFLVEDMDKKTAESIIKSNQAMFSEIYHERVVNNIYLDTVNMDNYFDNQVGVSQRVKVRIRWYGEMKGLIKKPVLELKIKNEDLGSKRLFPLKPFPINNNLSIQKIIDNITKDTSLPAYIIEILKSVKFVLLNRYTRKYFISADKKYRITLDHNNEFYKIHPTHNTFREEIKMDDYVIFELKYNKYEDYRAQKISNEFPFRLTKSSKYVSGMDLLGVDC